MSIVCGGCVVKEIMSVNLGVDILLCKQIQNSMGETNLYLDSNGSGTKQIKQTTP
jgi:hypothetical protein